MTFKSYQRQYVLISLRNMEQEDANRKTPLGEFYVTRQRMAHPNQIVFEFEFPANSSYNVQKFFISIFCG